MKAGGAYAPLDPSYPAERLQYMLEDAAPRLVLTQEKLRTVLPDTEAEVISLDETLQEIAGTVAQNVPAQSLNLTAEHLVYVIYTSGSTGNPKGTAMSHGSMANLIEWHRKSLPAGEGVQVLQFAALSFDVAFQEIFSTLCTGGTLILLDEWIRKDARELVELLSSRCIERLFVPPLMLQSLAESCQSAEAVPESLQDVIAAGEQLRITPEISKFFARLQGCRLHNNYGPTETHVVTAFTLSGDIGEWPSLPSIGRPIANTQIYILDGQRQPVPVGVPGEIFIGGVGLARGYLNRPELTAQRFIPDPFSGDPHARLYQTGDLGRWQADGTLECLGRNDDQVKIRGFRIELGEIEAQLARHPLVKEAVVVAREDVPGDQRLVVYLTKRDETGPSAEELRAHLKTVLPEHMVPSAFVALERLPLTPSGKLDRRALPAPEISAYASVEYEAPEGETEQALAEIWKELLHVEQVGRRDDFFDLGGHSLLNMRLIARIAVRFAVDLPMASIMEFSTVSELAGLIEVSRAGESTEAPSKETQYEEWAM
jgi:amino acid adenylation domain-containing protein